MHLGRCPVCHARISLDAVVQDEAGRELLGILSKLDTDTGAALVAYLALFRSASRDLSNAKALKLAKEVLAMAQPAAITHAMRQTVDNLLGKKPLNNHNYLAKVLADVPSGQLAAPIAAAAPLAKSKTAQALMGLEAMKDG